LEVNLPAHYEEWKKEIACKIQDKSKQAGIEPKYAIAAAILESGINPSAVGDSGCSHGILQVNFCVHNKKPSTDEQIDLWIRNFSEEYKKSGKWELGVVDWNWPAAAHKGIHKTQYFYKYFKILNQISV
jgi:hypothetical protein